MTRFLLKRLALSYSLSPVLRVASEVIFAAPANVSTRSEGHFNEAVRRAGFVRRAVLGARSQRGQGEQVGCASARHECDAAKQTP